MGLKKLIVVISLIVFVAISWADYSYAKGDHVLHEAAQEAVKNGNIEFAFMYFHSLLGYSTTSAYYEEALFATGEYYYQIGAFSNAEKSFANFIKHYPDSAGLPFAIVYFLKINREAQNSRMASDLRKKVITFQQLSLLFSEFKELLYKSPLGLEYKAVYFIDRVEIYINGELFENIYF